eukprot:gnl/Chilomastix_caulleri/5385.p1 GENE.gnl/Chilomastix_caulleri/5385~~gnl/Chilomastix_caulleri/5385.p1  ORF type:complete len:86 (+),score=3.35 gnl/Chilomastix_caulleri/5385:18-275(+)
MGKSFSIISDLITQRDMHWKLIIQAASAKDFKNRCKNTICSPPGSYIINFNQNMDKAIDNFKSIDLEIQLYDFASINQILKRLRF